MFGAPAIVREIVEKLTPAHEEGKKADTQKLDGMDTVHVDENGEVDLPQEIVIGRTQDLFGPKIYEEIKEDVTEQIAAISTAENTEVHEQLKNIAGTIKSNIKEKILPPAMEEYGVKKGAQGRLERQIEKEIDQTFDEIHDDYIQQEKLARTRLENKRQEAETEEEVQQAETEYQTDMSTAIQTLMATVQTAVEKTIAEKPQEVVERLERHKEEQEKRSVEEEVRAHLRGFSRTIPSFIMAYGDGNLTLENFEEHTENDVFLEVTGITEDDFRFLRDGGDYVDPETGETRHFEGHLFDEVVFNDSIEEFWQKKQQLANYFDESQDEDIFDYIPPQKTNQIFTPEDQSDFYPQMGGGDDGGSAGGK